MQTIEEFAEQVRALQKMLALANTGHMEEYAFAAVEHLTLSLLQQGKAAGLPESEALRTAAAVFQDLISIAENLGWPLSTEIENVIGQMNATGIRLRESGQRKPSRPLAQAPKDPPEFSIFVDESGSASFDEVIQPVLCLVGAIVKDQVKPQFERASDELLTKYRLSGDTEFHASEFLAASPDDGDLARLDVDERYRLLREFLTLGMQYVHGLHHLGMLKSMVQPAYRQKMLAQGLNPYTHTIVWFIITLDRACLRITMPGVYKYFYDRTDAYKKDIGRIFRALAQIPNERLRLFGLKGTPVMLESHRSRLIQLADVAGYFLNRHHQLDIPAIKPRQELEKHRSKVYEMYELMKPKIVDYLGKDLHITVDWKALADFSLRRQPPQWRPPVPGPRR